MRGALWSLSLLALLFGAGCPRESAPPSTTATARIAAGPGDAAEEEGDAAAPAPITAPIVPSASASSAVLDLHPPPDTERDKRIAKQYGNQCRLERTCGALWGIDCGAAVGGPYYYVRAGSLATVSACGGFCTMTRCTQCPPRDFACATP